MKYLSVAEMIAIEKESDANGHTYPKMMEFAGRGLAEAVHETYGYLADDGALGLVGSGNNGGDTLVALAYLADWGWKTCAAIVRSRQEDDELVARLKEAGGKIHEIDEVSKLGALGSLLEENAVLLDGVLGTGIKLPLRGELAQTLDFVRKEIQELENPPIVVAVDCPSGVDCDTGEAAPECIPAELTVTMAAFKQGLLKFPAYKLVGDLRLVGIGLPEGGESLKAWRAVKSFVPDADWVRGLLPKRPLDAHKGTFGTALVVAGSLNYTGAALLAGEAAYRAGAGLVTLAVPSMLHGALAGRIPEATWLPLADENGFIASHAAEEVLNNLERATALLVGPGFGLQGTTAKFLSRLFTSKNAQLPPVVIDADGLKLLTELPGWASHLPVPAILTPHPGEMSVLTGLPTKEIQAERLETARNYSQEWGHVVVLKGAFTVIAAPSGEAAIIPVATPALARAGTGDVLAGLIVGYRAQGLGAFESAVAGAWVHAYAGLEAGLKVGNTASVLAGDVLDSSIQVICQLS